ncbi:alpha-amylase [Saccharothrix sp. MB29]|nr:alpha-amylase [Saccharothrix sp. MB29]
MADHGYDVADPVTSTAVRRPGGLRPAGRRGPEHNIKVTIDLVPNHTSDRRLVPDRPAVGARLARAGALRLPRRRRLRRLRAAQQLAQPFGGPAWTRVPDGQWYLHLFAPEQPDLNWENPEVAADLARTLRFWLDRGVDGFRIDVAHGMAKPRDLRNMDPRAELGSGVRHDNAVDPRFDNDAVHDVHRLIRKVVDEYPNRMAVGEISSGRRPVGGLRAARRAAPGLNRLLEARSTPTPRAAVDHSLNAARSARRRPGRCQPRRAPARHPLRRRRLGAKRRGRWPWWSWRCPVSSASTTARNWPAERRAADWALQDPIWVRSRHADRGRDGCRVPLPWEGDTPPFGFSEAAGTWLPQPNEWAGLTVESQLEDPGSMLSFYRHALELRKSNAAFNGEELEWYGAPAGCFAFRRKGGGLICALNTSGGPVPLPPGGVLLASGPMDGNQLPPDTAVWLV